MQVGASAPQQGNAPAASNSIQERRPGLESRTQNPPTPATVAEATIPSAGPSRVEGPRLAEPVFPDCDAILEVLNRYASAYSNRDSKQVTSVFPSISREKLNEIKSFFKEQKAIRMSLAIQKLVPGVDDSHVILYCSQSLQYSEDGKPKSMSATVTINMVKKEKGWQIAEIPIS
jgi:hypothetical protein